MGYDENDAAYDDYIDDLYARFRREDGHEIASEITTGEVIGGALAAHRYWWPLTEQSFSRSRSRLAEGVFDEALFHAGRAFDGYVRNVLVIPLKAALVERLQESMPEGFSLKEDHFFKSMSGIGTLAAFAEYTISLIAPDDATALIEAFRALKNGGDGKPSWTERDRAFHAPIDVQEETASAILYRAEQLVSIVAEHAKRLIAAEDAEGERRDFSDGRVALLHALAQQFDDDPEAMLQDDVIPFPNVRDEEKREALARLGALGYLESGEEKDMDFFFARFVYRMTPKGRAYYEEHVLPRLPTHLRTPQAKTVVPDGAN